MTSVPSVPDTEEPNPLAPLLVIDRLEVGPVTCTADRVTATYQVTRGDEVESIELAYRYQEQVFDPSSPEDANLGSFIVAQVALNYGLFCREIVFRGSYTAADQEFLRRMMENTSREIYVNKILAENPFLDLDEVRSTPHLREHYTQAAVRFDANGDSGPVAPAKATPWATSDRRWAVLSSGGKDSLLSFGVLRELGCEVHPLYVNESGRHWFTALNAYRHFEQTVPHTARVWTNADRVFTWMLRRLSFVRPDFQRLRADIYPIRLWTVAVFLTSVLPLMRKRGLGWLVIGDEHDTTVRKTHEGIAHYDGLYDQSRYFDRAFSRFFAAKGWGVVQLSLLRPLSELLIEGILARRYPDLLACQTSCHATHAEGERMVPCGRCEKCRRIVAMLLAVDSDPTLCGYTPEGIEAARRSLVTDGVHQEAVGAAHLAALLWERKLIEEPRLGSQRAKLHPEVVSLRFHPDRSPVDEIPDSIRQPLLRLFRSHTEGALLRQGRTWIPYEPEGSGESPESRTDDEDAATTPTERTTYVWGELNWPQAEQALGRVDIALLPVGAIEQHGPHLPLDTDAFDAEYLVHRVAEACSEPRPLVLPLIPYGVSYHHDDFPGTLSVTNETLARFVYEIGLAVARNGIQKLIIINGHGGNSATLHFAAQMINRDTKIFTCVDSGESSDHEIYGLAETPNDVHAGEIETSTTLAIRPELVDLEVAPSFVPRFSSRYLDFTSKHSVGWYARTARLSETGVFGDPTRATTEKGHAMWKIMTDHLVELVEHLKGLTLDEIHERHT